MCLSCHDGTIALGNIISQTADIDFTSANSRTQGKSNLSTDLRDDHPVSFIFDDNLASEDGELVYPSTLAHPIHIEKNKLQCTSCHDPHLNKYTDFLVESTQYSAICISSLRFFLVNWSKGFTKYIQSLLRIINKVGAKV